MQRNNPLQACFVNRYMGTLQEGSRDRTSRQPALPPSTSAPLPLNRALNQYPVSTSAGLHHAS